MPTTFTLACADENQRLEQLEWKRWGHKRAYATGIVRENVGTPLSSGDRRIGYRVKVTASDLVDGEASATYNKLTVRVVGKTPKGVQRVEVFTLPGNEPIHPHVHEPADKARVIDHMAGWSDGYQGMSEDARSDGHEGMDR